MGNVSDNNCRENQNTRFYVQLLFSENRTFYEIMSKNIVETEPQMTSQYGAYALGAGLAGLHARMRMHTPTRPGTHTHKHAHTDQYVILIAFPQQEWFRERDSVLLYTHFACLVSYIFSDVFAAFKLLLLPLFLSFLFHPAKLERHSN
jgi:hypothetical protein